MNRSRIIVGIIILILLLGGVGIGVYLTQQQQDPRQRAEELGVTPTPTLAACIPNEGFCEWDQTPDATSYHYTVTETGSGSVVTEGDVAAPTTKITFTTEDNKTYLCSVYAINSCGEGPVGEGQSTCSVSPTPTVTGTPSPTPTGTPSPTPTPTGTPSPTPTGTPSPTPTVPVATATPTGTPSPTPTGTPVPTSTPVPTNTPIATATPTTPQQIVAGPTNTPTPTIEAPGSILQTVTIAGGVILTIIGALVLFIL